MKKKKIVPEKGKIEVGFWSCDIHEEFTVKRKKKEKQKRKRGEGTNF
jgi:hypothetical protein